MSPRGLLVVGTDTGVGKTTLSRGLLRLAQRRSLRLVPYKPVETGCVPHAHDALALCEAAALPGLHPDQVCPFQFPEPVAPSVAARLAGATPPSEELLLAHAKTLLARGDALLVESAGGLLTPYAAKLTSASLARLLDIDILLVGANRLGVINHAALALSEIHHLNLSLAGLVLVNVSAGVSPDLAHNASEITALTGIVPLGTLRHCDATDTDQLADAVNEDIALEPLFDGALA
jgi:dethiobiotin synthetase